MKFIMKSPYKIHRERIAVQYAMMYRERYSRFDGSYNEFLSAIAALGFVPERNGEFGLQVEREENLN